MQGARHKSPAAGEWGRVGKKQREENMAYIEPYILITISLFGVAYPILLQTVARLDDKYSSEHIVALFQREKKYKLFIGSLIASLVCIFIWSLNGWLNWSIFPVVAEILVVTAIIVLVCSFFCFVKKILIYHTTTKFISYLKKKDYKAPKNSQYLDAISDILLQFIRKKRPDTFQLCKFWTENKLQEENLPEQTYRDIWVILRCAVQYEQDDVIMAYWKVAHQYFKDYGEREKYMEFHYALGGYLLYKQRYHCIRELFEHLPSAPPEYVLLPNAIQDILSFYFKVWSLDTNEYAHIANLYSFPQESGWHAELVVRNAICSYTALLFLKQLLLNYKISGTSAIPPSLSLPEVQKEIRAWINALPSFKKLVNEHLENDNLMEIMKTITSLSFLFDKESARVHSLDFIENLELELKTLYERNTVELSPSGEKVKQFKDTIKKIIEEAIIKINQINNDADINDTDKYKTEEHLISKQEHILKDNFFEHSEIALPCFDTLLANLAKQGFRIKIANSFLDKKTKEISLPLKKILEAIDKLNINEQYVIVSFGLDLGKENYKNIPIYAFEGRFLLHNSLFILKKTDLPHISFQPVPDDIKEKYSLEKIAETHELYASVIDLNKAAPELLEECKTEFNKTEDELKKSALLNIFLNMEIKWKQELEILQIKQYTGRETSQANTLEEIIPF